MKRQIIRSVCCLGAVCALFVVLACSTPPLPHLEHIDEHGSRLNGIPAKDAPYLDIICHIDGRPLLVIVAGSETTNIPSGMWSVQVGDWDARGLWTSLLYKNATGHMPKQPFGVEMFNQMMSSDADKMTIVADKTYTFFLPEDVRTELNNKFSKSCTD